MSTEVVLAIAPSVEVVAVSSTHSADALSLAVGKPSQALVKASHVLVAIE